MSKIYIDTATKLAWAKGGTVGECICTIDACGGLFDAFSSLAICDEAINFKWESFACATKSYEASWTVDITGGGDGGYTLIFSDGAVGYAVIDREDGYLTPLFSSDIGSDKYDDDLSDEQAEQVLAFVDEVNNIYNTFWEV